MVSVSASVNLPLHHKVQKFSSGTVSLTHPGGGGGGLLLHIIYVLNRVLVKDEFKTKVKVKGKLSSV